MVPKSHSTVIEFAILHLALCIKDRACVGGAMVRKLRGHQGRELRPGSAGRALRSKPALHGRRMTGDRYIAVNHRSTDARSVVAFRQELTGRTLFQAHPESYCPTTGLDPAVAAPSSTQASGTADAGQISPDKVRKLPPHNRRIYVSPGQTGFVMLC